MCRSSLYGNREVPHLTEGCVPGRGPHREGEEP
jgi:hypothetical protein